MSRKRKEEWSWLAGTNVYFKMGRYALVTTNPYKETYLAPETATRAEVLTLWEQSRFEGNDTLKAMVKTYLKSEKYRRLKPATQESYERLLMQVINWEMPRFKTPFGSLKLAQINNKTIQSAFDQQEPNTARNRRFTVVKAVYAWGIQRFDGIDKNPVIGLELMAEPPRTRYITDDEWNHIYNLAPTTLRLMMEGAYLLRARRNELSSLHRVDNIKPKGVLIERTKGSWDGVVGWSPRLRKWVRSCKNNNKQAFSKYLMHNTTGGPITKSSLDSMWRRVWAKADPDIEHFTFHDIKAKGITDHPDKEGGHKSPKMKEVYDRENRKEKPTK